MGRDNTPVVVTIALLVLVYLGGYVAARLNHVIVHTQHGEVVAGDAKLASPNTFIAAVYTPLRWTEMATWWALEHATGRTGLPR